MSVSTLHFSPCDVFRQRNILLWFYVSSDEAAVKLHVFSAGCWQIKNHDWLCWNLAKFRCTGGLNSEGKKQTLYFSLNFSVSCLLTMLRYNIIPHCWSYSLRMVTTVAREVTMTKTFSVTSEIRITRIFLRLATITKAGKYRSSEVKYWCNIKFFQLLVTLFGVKQLDRRINR